MSRLTMEEAATFFIKFRRRKLAARRRFHAAKRACSFVNEHGDPGVISEMPKYPDRPCPARLGEAWEKARYTGQWCNQCKEALNHYKDYLEYSNEVNRYLAMMDRRVKTNS